ncbi:MAG: GRP family sugar transporter [Candidatus Gastranaerophilales bacterium]|nr:GRP family sugar transporter [Candidatus Gastranaerophilales bacterium]
MELLYTSIILRILSNPVANVVQKKLVGTGRDVFRVNFFTYILLGFCCLIYLPLFFNNNYSLKFWEYALIGGFFGAFGNAFLIKALKTGELSVLGPINSYKAVVGLIFGIILLGEIPKIYGLIGMFFVILGSYFVFDTLEEKFTWKIFLRKDVRYRLLALIFTGIEAIFIKKVIVLSSPLASFCVWCWFGALFSFLILFFKSNNVNRKIKPEDISKYILLAVLMGLMQLSTNFVFERMNVGYALSLFQLSTLVSVFLGYRIFHEKEIKKKLVGASIMIFGAILIILQ